MVRPKRHDNRISIGLRMPVSLHEMLQQAAEDRDVSMNWLVNRAITEFLDRLIPAGEIVLTRNGTPK